MFARTCRRQLAPIFMALTLIFWVPLCHAAAAGAQALAATMLNRLGGRAAWAGLKNTINGSQQNRATEPTVVYAILTMDFERPRFRIETSGQAIHLIRVIDGDRSWRLNRAGDIEDLPDEKIAEDMAWYEAHLYRTIHRIAARDPSLKPGISDDGRLEVFSNQQRLLWFRLDAEGEPYAFGFRDDEIGSLCGPWDVVKEGIHHPRWVSSADGSWRAAVKALEINVPLHPSMFARPDN